MKAGQRARLRYRVSAGLVVGMEAREKASSVERRDCGLGIYM